MKNLSLFILLLLYSCLIVPLPSHREEGRVFIKPETIAFVVTGQTSREEILLRLGDPDAVALDQAVFIYEWTPTVGYAAVGGPGAAAVSNIQDKHFYLVAFGKDNKVIRHEIIKHNIDKKGNLLSFIRNWLSSKN